MYACYEYILFMMQTVIARRSDMLVMSSDGPLGAYVNAHGFVHDVMTLYRATGLALVGPAVREYSWFPGYGPFSPFRNSDELRLVIDYVGSFMKFNIACCQFLSILLEN